MINSIDYPGDIQSIIQEVEITVQECVVTTLAEPDDVDSVSPLYLVYELPYFEFINLPLYEPSPACMLSNDDLTYEIDESDTLP